MACFTGVALAHGVSLQEFPAIQPDADDEEEVEEEKLDGVFEGQLATVIRGDVVDQAKLDQAKAFCNLIHAHGPCLFWDKNWGAVPEFIFKENAGALAIAASVPEHLRARAKGV
ncbi:hypothetical protein MNEG_11445 [Monoraphidium neglectum]|uniref:Uncharacterized protein n=1 Tax=Monoraphidium neglectum TaxID=145388 RepID=A0A0D2LYP0_9CHLO|nr:hypothetical protein MNEG_11445 [Monoraphidium neglectum]KIY96514.1 hypothetical protein MNEG_11445 [Monoraphidium neglectum]|eukprot:XP_013895534.1 hypothetical protein MNEG_11445 [Monoraphidium neglectum]